MKKIFYLLVTASLFSFVCNAQQTETDSLKNLLSHTTDDTARVMLMHRLNIVYEYSHPDSSLHYADLGLQLARKIKFSKGEAKCLNDIGTVLFDIGNYPAALDYFFQSIKIKEQLKDEHGIAVTSFNIAGVYAETGEVRKAISVMLQVIKSDEAFHSEEGIMYDHLNLGEYYSRLGIDDSAMMMEQLALESAIILEDNGVAAASLHFMGSVLMKEKNYTEAMKSFRESISYALPEDDFEDLSGDYVALSEIFRAQGKPDSGLLYAHLAFYTAQQSQQFKRMKNAATGLSDWYASLHQTDSAFHYYKLAVAANDSIYSSEKIKQVQKLTFDEEQRQMELSERRAREQEERRANLQLLGILLFILILFSITIALRRRKIKPAVIEVLGLFSLLLFFEFTNILLEPWIAVISHHVPIIKLGWLVGVVSVMVPLHEFMKDFVKVKLAGRRRGTIV